MGRPKGLLGILANIPRFGGQIMSNGKTIRENVFPAKTKAKTVDSGEAVSKQAVSRRARVKAQTQLSPAPSGRAGLRTSLARTPGRSGIGIN